MHRGWIGVCLVLGILTGCKSPQSVVNARRATLEPKLTALQQWADAATASQPVTAGALTGPPPVFGTPERPGVNALVVSSDALAQLGSDYESPVNLETDGGCLHTAASLLRRGKQPGFAHWKTPSVEQCAEFLESVRYALVLLVRDNTQADLLNRTTFRAGSYSATAYLLDLQTQQAITRFPVTGYNDSTVTTSWGGSGVRTNLWGHARESLRTGATAAIPGVRFWD